MQNNFTPLIDVVSSMTDTKMDTGMTPMRLKPVNTPETPSFSQVMNNMVTDLNDSINAPDQVLQNAITGNGADVHDVMIAMSKAEIGLNIATQVTTKVIQSYEKIMSIQV
jgi:flagellar hook-basal body complex protein FliE